MHKREMTFVTNVHRQRYYNTRNITNNTITHNMMLYMMLYISIYIYIIIHHNTCQNNNVFA